MVAQGPAPSGADQRRLQDPAVGEWLVGGHCGGLWGRLVAEERQAIDQVADASVLACRITSATKAITAGEGSRPRR